MSTPDSLLIAWWLMVIAPCVSWILLVKWVRTANRQTATLIALKGGWIGRYGPPMLAQAALRTIGIVTGVLSLIWLAGLVAFIWMGHWTTLLLLNFQLFMVLLGVTFVGAGL